MPVIIYSVYVGKYDKPSAVKNDLKKINSLGLQGFTFSRNSHYALKVFTSPNKEKALYVKRFLEGNGFETEFEERVVKN